MANRRHAVIREITWGNNRVHVAVGLSPKGDICEVFARGPKIGTESWAMLQDACVFISRRRKRGETFAEMRQTATKGAAGEPLSIMGAVLEAAAQMENELCKTS